MTRSPRPLREAHAIRLVVTGPPRTKKTSNVVAVKNRKHPVVLPSKLWREWVKRAHIQMGVGEQQVWARAIIAGKSWVNWPVNICATFYRERDAGDFLGYAQGIADLLQARRIIADDVLLRSWDGSRLLKDKNVPRVEVTLSPLGAP